MLDFDVDDYIDTKYKNPADYIDLKEEEDGEE